MEKYKNENHSGINKFEIKEDRIIVDFHGHKYEYTSASYGQTMIEKMKKLAEQGKNLNTFINKNHLKGKKIEKGAFGLLFFASG